MREASFGGPFDVVASSFGDKEGLAAALISVAVDALLDGKVKNRAAGDRGGYESLSVYEIG